MKKRDRINANTYGMPIPRLTNYSITDLGRVYQWTRVENRVTKAVVHRWVRVKEFTHEDGTICAIVGEVKKIKKHRSVFVPNGCAEVGPRKVARVMPIWVMMHMAFHGGYPAKLRPHYLNGDNKDNSLANLRFLPIKQATNTITQQPKADLSMVATGEAPKPKLEKKPQP